MKRDLGEFELIERLRSRLGRSKGLRVGMGDDAAVVEGGSPRVVSVDSAVDGVHFDSRTWPAEAIAWKAIAAAVSDIAAMAAVPVEVYLGLGLPAGTDEGLLDGLVEGTAAVTGHLDIAVAGGDTVASPVLFLAVTVVGETPGHGNVVTRSGARPGDLVAVTGAFGGAAAGLRLVGESAGGHVDAGEADLLNRLFRPEPRLAFGRRLGSAGVTSLIDVSDGLVADLGHLASSSGVGIEIDAGLVPVQEGVEGVAGRFGLEVLDFALAGGEDYELAMTLAPDALARLSGIAAECDLALAVVGSVVDGSGVAVSLDGRPFPVPDGFEHRF